MCNILNENMEKINNNENKFSNSNNIPVTISSNITPISIENNDKENFSFPCSEIAKYKNGIFEFNRFS